MTREDNRSRPATDRVGTICRALRRANIEQALRTIAQMGGSGSTEIVPALKRIAALPKSADVSRSVIVVTDGYVSVESEVFQLVRRNLGNSNVFAFGIGSSARWASSWTIR